MKETIMSATEKERWWELIKSNCVSCGKRIETHDKYWYYYNYGNYCRDCITRITENVKNKKKDKNNLSKYISILVKLGKENLAEKYGRSVRNNYFRSKYLQRSLK